MKIKVCGISRPQDAKAAISLGADYLGLVFAASPRQVDLKQSLAIIKRTGAFKNWVGVYVNASLDEVLTSAKKLNLSAVQLHGEESPAYCQELKKNEVRVIKAFRIKDHLAKLNEYEDADFWLLDAFAQHAHGGTGKTFNWEILERLKITKSFFLSGGICSENLEYIPMVENMVGIDVSSSLERSPGCKSLQKMRAFFKQSSATMEDWSEL